MTNGLAWMFAMLVGAFTALAVFAGMHHEAGWSSFSAGIAALLATGIILSVIMEKK